MNENDTDWQKEKKTRSHVLYTNLQYSPQFTESDSCTLNLFKSQLSEHVR